MNIALVLALSVLAQLPARAPMLFPEPPVAEVWVSEDWPADSLKALARQPSISVGLHTRSNMLRPEVARTIGRGSLVEISPMVAVAHVEEFRRMPDARLVLTLPPTPSNELHASLSRLGRQELRIRVNRLDSPRAAWLARVSNAEVELDLCGRLPEQQELALFLGLDRTRRVVRLRADDPPEMLVGLARLGLVRVVVEARANRLPLAMIAALHTQSAAVRVRLEANASAVDLLRFAHLPGISFELELGAEADRELAQINQLLRDSTLHPAVPELQQPPEGDIYKSAHQVDSRLDREGEPK